MNTRQHRGPCPDRAPIGAASFVAQQHLQFISGNVVIVTAMQWTFLSNHGKALLCIARDPGARIRDIANAVAITERRAHDIVTDLAAAGYVVKTKEGRRNRYTIQSHLPLPEGSGSNRTVGELLHLLAGTEDQR